MLQTHAVAHGVDVAELEQPAPDKPFHAVGGRIDPPHGARLAIGDVEHAVQRGEPARLRESRAGERSVMDRLVPAPRGGPDDA